METPEFLYLQECPIPLLGRDLLTKLRAQITFTYGGLARLTVRVPNALIMAVTMPTEDGWQLYCQEKGDLKKPICLLEEFSDVWAGKGPLGLVSTMCLGFSLLVRDNIQCHGKHAWEFRPTYSS
jgi:hypothetical protein